MLKVILLLITLALSLVSIPLGSWTEWGIFIGLMALTGIPHGATDHLIYEQVHGRMHWQGFFGLYLGSMLVYALLWWAFPHVSLMLFLGLSAYHFGESQFLRFDRAGWPDWTKGWYVLWGFWVLILIIGGHEVASVGILAGMPMAQAGVHFLGQHLQAILTWLGIPLLLGFGYLGWKRHLSWGWVGLELCMLGSLWALGGQGSLLVSFAVYFGLWHACQSIEGELASLRTSFRLWDWMKAAWPFSLISFAGLGLLLLSLPWWGGHISPLLVFFVLISVLTLPHMQLMERLYRRNARKTVGWSRKDEPFIQEVRS